MTVNELIEILESLSDDEKELQVRFFYFAGDRNCTQEIKMIGSDVANDGTKYIELAGY